MGRHRKIVELVDQQVAHALDDVERTAKALELAQMCGEIDQLRADAADAAGTERKRIRALEKRRRLLAECVRTGNEMRSAQEELFGAAKSAPRSETAPAFTAPAEAPPPCGDCGHAEHASGPGQACGFPMVNDRLDRYFCVCGLNNTATNASEPDVPPPAAAKEPLIPSSADFVSPFEDETEDDFAARPGTSDGYVGAQLAAPTRARGSKSKGTNGTAK